MTMLISAEQHLTKSNSIYDILKNAQKNRNRRELLQFEKEYLPKKSPLMLYLLAKD